MPNPAVIARLREELQALDSGRFDRRETLPFGIGAVDAMLAGGGLRLDSLHEVAGASAGMDDDAAATLFVAGIAARAWGPVLWVVRRPDLFAPPLAQVGLSDTRVIHAEARTDADLIGIMEEGLRHRALGAVIGEVTRIGLPATRRLQLAAQGGRTIALLLKRHAKAAADPLGTATAAVTGWRVGSARSAARSLAGSARGRWRVGLARHDAGATGEWLLEACDETGRCALSARSVDRSRASCPAVRRAA